MTRCGWSGRPIGVRDSTFLQPCRKRTVGGRPPHSWTDPRPTSPRPAPWTRRAACGSCGSPATGKGVRSCATASTPPATGRATAGSSPVLTTTTRRWCSSTARAPSGWPGPATPGRVTTCSPAGSTAPPGARRCACTRPTTSRTSNRS